METLIGFMIFWIATIITSYGMCIAHSLRMSKDIADAGYKIDIERMKEANEKINPNINNITMISLIIPFFNIIMMMQVVIQYNNERPTLLSKFRLMDVLDEMTDIEKVLYSKNPTGLNAIIIPLKIKRGLEKIYSLKISNENENSEIFYKIDTAIHDIIILKVTGDAAKLSLGLQKIKVIESWRDEFKEKDCDKENSINTLDVDSNTNIDIKESENTLIQKLIDLENLKKELEELLNNIPQVDNDGKPPKRK